VTPPFQDGEQVLLIDTRGKRHLVFLRKSETFHSDRGWVPHDSIIGQSEGSWVRSSMGLRHLAVRPTLAEYVLEMPRGAQVIYPKDLGPILILADVFPGAKVLESGVGSGALTLALLRAVGSTGLVTGYEIRDDFARRAQANVEGFLGSDVPLTVEVRDIYEGIELTDIDRVLLDLPEPWRVVKHAEQAMHPGGIMLAYLPTIGQVARLREELAGSAFGMIETLEVLQRTWHVDGQSVRPDHRMVAHTGFLTHARLLSPGA
jgi:tRNA (adenine57-N1/adenine58-N1)-methyltransferase catalytic subunit